MIINILIWVGCGLPGILFLSLIWYRDFDRITLNDLICFTCMSIIGGPLSTVSSVIMYVGSTVYIFLSKKIDGNRVIFSKKDSDW